MKRVITVVPWHQSTCAQKRAGEFLAGGAPLNFIAKTRPVPNSVSSIPPSSDTHVRKVLPVCCSRFARHPGHQTRVAQVSRGCLQPVSLPRLRTSHPTFQAPWRHHYRRCASRRLRLSSPSRPHHAQHLYLRPAAGHTGHTSQGSRQFFMNTPHSLSEDVPAALSSISNQAGPGTKAQ